MSARLSHITVYPIKSLDGVELNEAAVLPGGALAFDRRFALIDADGRFINGKRTAAVHRIRAEFDLPTMNVHVRSDSETRAEPFSLADDRTALGQWFSAALGIACVFAENATSGFPDDTEAPGPTLVSTATLQEVARWFPGMTFAEARRRFRANLEIDGVEPFWEDRLVGPPGTEVAFEIGGVRWLGVTACQRCVVPTRDSASGEATPTFQKTLTSRREAALPRWAPAARFDHFYRLAVNTRLAASTPVGKVRIGDSLRPV